MCVCNADWNVSLLCPPLVGPLWPSSSQSALTAELRSCEVKPIKLLLIDGPGQVRGHGKHLLNLSADMSLSGLTDPKLGLYLQQVDDRYFERSVTSCLVLLAKYPFHTCMQPIFNRLMNPVENGPYMVTPLGGWIPWVDTKMKLFTN